MAGDDRSRSWGLLRSRSERPALSKHDLSADGNSLERDPQPQPGGAAAVHTFLGECGERTPEVLVGVYIFQDRLEGGIYHDIKAAKIRKATVCEIQVRHSYWVIEDIVEVGTQSGSHALAEFKVFMHTQIHPPRPRSPQEVLSGDSRVVKNVCAHGRRRKRIGVEKLISYMLFVIADDQRPVADEIIEITKRAN